MILGKYIYTVFIQIQDKAPCLPPVMREKNLMLNYSTSPEQAAAQLQLWPKTWSQSQSWATAWPGLSWPMWQGMGTWQGECRKKQCTGHLHMHLGGRQGRPYCMIHPHLPSASLLAQGVRGRQTGRDLACYPLPQQEGGVVGGRGKRRKKKI